MTQCASPANSGTIFTLLTLSSLFLRDSSFQDEHPANTESSEICSWDGSLLQLIDCVGTLEMIRIANSSNRPWDINDGTIAIIQAHFETNNSQLDTFPLFRRDITCFLSFQAPKANRTIASLKRGDGLVTNSSLWIRPNDSWEPSTNLNERPSPFFVPTLLNYSFKKSGLLTKSGPRSDLDRLFRSIFLFTVVEGKICRIE